jgi:hypothetical protein
MKNKTDAEKMNALYNEAIAAKVKRAQEELESIYAEILSLIETEARKGGCSVAMCHDLAQKTSLEKKLKQNGFRVNNRLIFWDDASIEKIHQEREEFESKLKSFTNIKGK